MATQGRQPDDRPPLEPAPFGLRLAVVLYLLLIGFFFLLLLFDTWSGDLAVPGAIFFLPDDFLTSKLFQSFMMASSGGGLGGVIYSILAFHRHASVRQDFATPYAWGFFLSPLVAMVLGAVMFALVQGGLLVFAAGAPAPTTLADMGYFGFGFLAGFGWNSVTEKLRELINQFFGGSPDQRGLSPELEQALLQFMEWRQAQEDAAEAAERGDATPPRP